MGKKIGEQSPHGPKEHLENVEVAFGRNSTDLLRASLPATSLQNPFEPCQGGASTGWRGLNFLSPVAAAQKLPWRHMVDSRHPVTSALIDVPRQTKTNLDTSSTTHIIKGQMPRQYTTLQSGLSHGNEAQIKPPLLVIWIKAYISFSQPFKYFIWSFYLNNYAAL